MRLKCGFHWNICLGNSDRAMIGLQCCICEERGCRPKNILSPTRLHKPFWILSGLESEISAVLAWFDFGAISQFQINKFRELWFSLFYYVEAPLPYSHNCFMYKKLVMTPVFGLDLVMIKHGRRSQVLSGIVQWANHFSKIIYTNGPNI